MNPASPSYTVVLTKGAHTVGADDANAILAAIQSGEKLVNVALEMYPGSNEVRPTTLVTAHVIAVSEVETPQRELIDAAGPRVRSLMDYRSG